MEILDHHHIGSIETTQPVRATFDPVGSTATLVTEQFLAAGHVPTGPTALPPRSALSQQRSCRPVPGHARSPY